MFIYLKRLLIVIAAIPVFIQFTYKRVQGSENCQNLINCTYSFNSVKEKLANTRLPELSGGPESGIRTRRHNPEYRNVFYNGPERKEIALTFDDGPDARFTPQILDILDRSNIKATFFIVGIRAEAYPEILKRIIKEGHVIGNHTWNHPETSNIPLQKIRDQLDRTNLLLYRMTGCRPVLFRPPYGAAANRIIREADLMGFKVIDWSVDTLDWVGTPAPGIIKIVKKEIHPGSIVLQHCAGGRGESMENTVRALPEIIAVLREQGYKFVTIPKLLGIPASK